MRRGGDWGEGCLAIRHDQTLDEALKPVLWVSPASSLNSSLNTHLGKRKIYLQTQSLTASLCSIHHVIKPEDISWFFFSSKSENQAETILTNYKSTQMPNFLLGGLDTVTRWEINFLSMNVNKLLLLCALYNHIYCIKSWH